MSASGRRTGQRSPPGTRCSPVAESPTKSNAVIVPDLWLSAVSRTGWSVRRSRSAHAGCPGSGPGYLPSGAGVPLARFGSADVSGGPSRQASDGSRPGPGPLEPGDNGQSPAFRRPIAFGCRSVHRGSRTGPCPGMPASPSRDGRACRRAGPRPRLRPRVRHSHGTLNLLFSFNIGPLISWHGSPSEVVPVSGLYVAGAFRGCGSWVSADLAGGTGTLAGPPGAATPRARARARLRGT